MITMKIKGLKELDRALAQLPDAVAYDVIQGAALEALQPMADMARRLAPEDPSTPDPDLNTSIVVSPHLKAGRATKFRGNGPYFVRVFMGPNMSGYPQAIMQEFGTRNHGAQPYMRPAFEDKKVEAVKILKDRLWVKIRDQAVSGRFGA